MYIYIFTYIHTYIHMCVCDHRVLNIDAPLEVLVVSGCLFGFHRSGCWIRYAPHHVGVDDANICSKKRQQMRENHQNILYSKTHVGMSHKCPTCSISRCLDPCIPLLPNNVSSGMGFLTHHKHHPRVELLNTCQHFTSLTRPFQSTGGQKR